MKSGFDAVKEAVERSNSQFSNAGVLNFIGWKAGEKKIVRFLTDEVITTDWYDFVVNKDGKNVGSFPNPLQVGWNEDFVQKYGGLNSEKNEEKQTILVPAKAREKTVGVAVVRKEVPVTIDGRTIQGVGDLDDEVEVEGKKYPSRNFVVISQSYKNFWATIVGYFSRYATACDRDYEITRVGSGTDTTYTIIPCDPIDGLRTVEEVQKFYGYGTKRADDDVERFRYCPQTLPEWIKNQANEEFIKKQLSTSGSSGSQTAPEGIAQVQTTETPTSGFNEFQQATSSNPEVDDGGLKAALIQNK